MEPITNDKPLDIANSITPDEMDYAQACARRAYLMALDMVKRLRQKSATPGAFVDPDPVLILMDICNVHKHSPIKLFAWFLSDDLAFAADYITLAKNVDRACGGLKNGARLRFSAANFTS